MHSDMISKIEKARQYAEEPQRIQITELQANFHGTNGTHLITLQDGHWSADNNGGTGPHVMAMQRVLDAMLAPEAREPVEQTGYHMHSEVIGKIEKARRYAEEPDRIQIFALKANFRGSNKDHIIILDNGNWSTDGDFFRNWGTSAHIMAMQRVLGDMLVPEARQPAEVPVTQSHGETSAL